MFMCKVSGRAAAQNIILHRYINPFFGHEYPKVFQTQIVSYIKYKHNFIITIILSYFSAEINPDRKIYREII